MALDALEHTMTTNQDINPTSDGPRRVAVVGHRSFIGRELLGKLRSDPRNVVTELPKDALSSDLSGFDSVYLILGNAKPEQWQEEKEHAELAAFLMNPRRPYQAVYMSSMALTPHKERCEAMVKALGTDLVHQRFCTVTIRPPAVFGPNQPIDSPMLIPQIVSEGGSDVKLRTPDAMTWFISVSDLAVHLVKFADPQWWDIDRCAQPGSGAMIPGSFCVTPRNVLHLYHAFKGLELQDCWRAQSSGW